jgi:hypothetical protein
MYAPILLFVYNRPLHTRRTIEALIKNHLADQSNLIVYADGPKSDKDTASIEEVRRFVRSVKGFRSIHISESPINKGLADSIIHGVTETLRSYEKVIVLEDDLVTSPHFLAYMNECLALYENDDQVISIHGYTYPVEGKLPETFFIRGADCWGWATWRRGWAQFEADGRKLLNELRERKLTEEFDFNNSFPFTQMLINQIEGKNNSWAIRWNASAFLKGRLTLYPGVTMVENIGFDSGGTHSGKMDQEYNSTLSTEPVNIEKILPAENREARQLISVFFRKFYKKGFRRILDRLTRIFR